MPIPATAGAFAIVPSNDLPAAVPFWERLGFARVGGDANYIIMAGWDCEVHLTQAGSGPWRVPEEHNPFGVFIRTPHVAAIAARVDDLIIRPGGVLRPRVGPLRGGRVWARRLVGSHRLALPPHAGRLGGRRGSTIGDALITWSGPQD